MFKQKQNPIDGSKEKKERKKSVGMRLRDFHERKIFLGY